MSYINASLLNDLQGKGGLNEKYFGELGLINAVKASTPSVDYIPQDAKTALNSTSSLRNYKIPYITDQTVVVNTSPGFSYIPSNLETSDVFYFVPYDIFSGLRHYRASYENNMVGEREAFNAKMNNILYAMAAIKEGIIATQLEVIKTQQLSFTTQVSQGDGTFSFSTGTDTLTINKAAQKDQMFSNLDSLMRANLVGGNYRMITNLAGTTSAKNEIMKYGANNDKNLQSAGMFTMDRLHESVNVSAGSSVFEGWLMRDGAMGMIENYPYDFRNGTVVGNRKWSISDTALPFLGTRCNIYTNTEATDSTALITSGTDSNLIMSSFEEMAIWDRGYLVYRPNSDRANRVSDVVKIVGATS